MQEDTGTFNLFIARL